MQNLVQRYKDVLIPQNFWGKKGSNTLEWMLLPAVLFKMQSSLRDLDGLLNLLLRLGLRHGDGQDAVLYLG